MPAAVDTTFAIIGAVCFWFIFTVGVIVIFRTGVRRGSRAFADWLSKPELDDDDETAAAMLAKFRAFRPPQGPQPTSQLPDAVRKIMHSEPPAETEDSGE